MTATPVSAEEESVRRKWLAWLGERVIGLKLRLPPATTDYRVTRGLTVPMRDGVGLVADHYAPVTPAPTGTVLIRSPYARTGLIAAILAGLFAQRGYHVVVQSARGTFGSEGVFDPMRDEIDDGADTVAWLRRQPWFTGRFTTVGTSYLGIMQWALLVDPPPELAAVAIGNAPHDMGAAMWGSGSFALADFLGWSYQVAHQEESGLRLFIRSAMQSRRLRPAMATLPLADGGRAVLKDGAPWYRTWLEHPDAAADYYRPGRLTEALHKARSPVLLVSGWQDVFLSQTLEQYRHLRERNVHVELVVGPWTHGDGGWYTARESFRWVEQHLGSGQQSTSPVRIFVTGGTGWRDLAQWPPDSTDRVLYLHPGSALADAPPSPDAPPSRFVYDPSDPTPTVGGRLLLAGRGYRDDNRLASRHDVVHFTSRELTEDLEVIGSPSVELAHSTDIPWADVFVRVSEVDRKGRSRNVSDGYVRLGPGAATPLRLELDAIAHRFRSGHRIRLLVAGGSHPRFARNLGTGDPPVTGVRLMRSTHVLAHGDGGVSRVVLPVAS